MPSAPRSGKPAKPAEGDLAEYAGTLEGFPAPEGGIVTVFYPLMLMPGD